MKLIIILSAILFPLFSLAQSETSKTQVFYIIKSPGSSKEILSKNLMIDGSGFAKLDFLPVSEGIKRFGPTIPKDAVIALVTLKSGVKLSTLSQFYATHGIKGNRRKLPFSINGSKTDTTNLLIADNLLKSIKIRTDSIEIITFGHVKELERQKLKVRH